MRRRASTGSSVTGAPSGSGGASILMMEEEVVVDPRAICSPRAITVYLTQAVARHEGPPAALPGRTWRPEYNTYCTVEDLGTRVPSSVWLPIYPARRCTHFTRMAGSTFLLKLLPGIDTDLLADNQHRYR